MWEECLHTFVGLGRQNESEAASGRSRTEPQAEHRESESEDPTVQPVCLAGVGWLLAARTRDCKQKYFPAGKTIPHAEV